MGSRLFSNTTNLLGGRDFAKAADRQRIAQLLGIPVERIPCQNSWAYDQILEGIRTGAIRGLWVIATNTAHSWIHQLDARALLDQLDFLVVQDMYHTTETAQRAHLVLPAAGWGEKEGTFIISERRIGLTKKVAQAPGQALSDFAIFQLVAEYWGCADLFRRWSTPEATFQILKEVSAGQPCDMTGIADYQMLDRLGGVQWPCSAAFARHFDPTRTALPRERRLFEDHTFFTPNGRARFVFETPQPPPEPPDAQFPFLLLTGRGTSAQWHTQTRTAKSAVLRQLYPDQAYLEIHPSDAAGLSIRSGQWVRVTSRRGSIQAQAVLTAAVQPGQVFLPMHYAQTNQLTFPAFDPCSRQPSYKACAVALARVIAAPSASHTGIRARIRRQISQLP
jgi:assimilatory nitrate reductase catalytic subunit